MITRSGAQSCSHYKRIPDSVSAVSSKPTGMKHKASGHLRHMAINYVQNYKLTVIKRHRLSVFWKHEGSEESAWDIEAKIAHCSLGTLGKRAQPEPGSPES